MRVDIYIGGMAVTAALLLAGCSHNDVAFEAVSGASVPIAFFCDTDSGQEDATDNGLANALCNSLAAASIYGWEPTRAVIGHQGSMDSEDLRYTGFGVFASQNADGTPDMMYNQEVKFTFVGDRTNPQKGYWSYQPLKYWPSSMASFRIGAYAPYTEHPTAGGDDTGIIGLSGNSATPYVEYRRCLNPESCVDLLWYYEKPTAVPAATADHDAGTLSMRMNHALARVQLRLQLDSDPGADTKVLVEQIVLTGSMAKTGRLSLSDQTVETETVGEEEVTKYFPIWSDQTYEDCTITIDNDDGSTEHYGLVDPQVRYVEGLPYQWQPAGLTTEPQNALSTVDRLTYVYLIPQPSLSLTIKVKYHKMTASSNEWYWKTTTSALPTPIGTPLRGNTTYKLNITLSNI